MFLFFNGLSIYFLSFKLKIFLVEITKYYRLDLIKMNNNHFKIETYKYK